MAEEQKKSGALAAFAGGGALANVSKAAMAEALARTASDGSTGGGEGIFLSFSGQGANYSGWRLGRDKSAPDPDALYVVDPESAVEGWTCWKGGSPVEKHEWSVYQRATHAVPASQLRDHGPFADDGDGWQFMLGISMFDVDQPEVKIMFSSTSKSGKNTIADLIAEVSKRIVDDEPYIPIIRLDDEKFTARGKVNGKPLMPVEGWVSKEEVMAYLDAGDDGDVEDLLSGGYAVKEEAPADEAPSRAGRRTRRSAA